MIVEREASKTGNHFNKPKNSGIGIGKTNMHHRNKSSVPQQYRIQPHMKNPSIQQQNASTIDDSNMQGHPS